MEIDESARNDFFLSLEANKKEKLCTDLLLITNDNKQIPVHKIVLLSSKSNYFRTLIQGNLKEEEYLDICSTQLEIILNYLYTGIVNVTDFAENKALYGNAQKFEITYLKEYSTKKLLNNITLDYSLEYFRHAVSFSIELLESKILDFIAENTKEFFDKFLWDLSEEELVRILINREKLKIEEMSLYRILKNWIFLKYHKRTEYIDKILLKFINFHKIPSRNYYGEIENDSQLKEYLNFTKKIAEINIKKPQSNLQEVFPEIVSSSGQEHLYLISFPGINIYQINIEEEFSKPKLLCENHKINQSDYAMCNFKYDNNEYFIFSGGATYEFHKDELISDCFNSNFIWRPNNGNSLTEFPSLMQKRSFHRTLFLDDKIYACGGYTSKINYDNKIPTKSIEFFDFGEEKWLEGPEFIKSKQCFGLSTLDRCLYAIGGDDNKCYVERLDPRDKNWKVISPEFEFECMRCVQCSGSSILCIGKNKPTFIFDIRYNTFTEDQYYNRYDEYKLQKAFRINKELYGAYFTTIDAGKMDLNIRKLNNDCENAWKTVKRAEQYFQLFTLLD